MTAEWNQTAIWIAQEILMAIAPNTAPAPLIP